MFLKIIIKNLLVFIILFLYQNLSLAFDSDALENLKQLTETLKTLQRSLQGIDQKEVPKNYKAKKFNSKPEFSNLEDFQKKLENSQRDLILSQCESMKKEKESLVSSAGKKILAGAAVGAAVGAAAAGKNRRTEGAILGAITGMIAATGYELWTKKDLIEEDAYKVAQKVGYRPEQGIYLKIREIKPNKENVKMGESLTVIVRLDYLFPEAIDSEKLKNSGSFNLFGSLIKGNNEEKPAIFHEVTIKAYYLKENQEVFVAEETYNIPPGCTPFETFAKF